MSQEQSTDPFADAPPEIRSMLDQLPPHLRDRLLAEKVKHDQQSELEGEAFSAELSELIDSKAPCMIKQALVYASNHPEDPSALVALIALVLGGHLRLKQDQDQLRNDLEALRKSHEAWISDL